MDNYGLVSFMRIQGSLVLGSRVRGIAWRDSPFLVINVQTVLVVVVAPDGDTCPVVDQLKQRRRRNGGGVAIVIGIRRRSSALG